MLFIPSVRGLSLCFDHLGQIGLQDHRLETSLPGRVVGKEAMARQVTPPSVTSCSAVGETQHLILPLHRVSLLSEEGAWSRGAVLVPPEQEAHHACCPAAASPSATCKDTRLPRGAPSLHEPGQTSQSVCLSACQHLPLQRRRVVLLLARIRLVLSSTLPAHCLVRAMPCLIFPAEVGAFSERFSLSEGPSRGSQQGFTGSKSFCLSH